MGYAARSSSPATPISPVGGRYYGWFPMATTVTFSATATPDGFRDDGAHRASAPARSTGPTSPPTSTPTTTRRRRRGPSRGAARAVPDRVPRRRVLRRLGGATRMERRRSSVRSRWSCCRRRPRPPSASPARRQAGWPRRGGLTSAANAEFVRSLGFSRLGGHLRPDRRPRHGCRARRQRGHRHGGQPERARGRAPATRRPDQALDDDRPEPSRCRRDRCARVAPRSGAAVLLRADRTPTSRRRCGAPTSIDAAPSTQRTSSSPASRAWMTIDERRGADGPASAWASIHAGDVAPMSA